MVREYGRQRRSAGGFSLVETAVAIVIVSLAVLAIVASQQTFHAQNDEAQQLSLGLSLANELREITLNLPTMDPISGTAVFGPEADELGADVHESVTFFDDLDDFAGVGGGGIVFSPPISALRETIPDLEPWSQQITVENVSPTEINGPAVADHGSDLLRMTVVVRREDPNDQAVTEEARLTWVTTGGN
jgi:type II secretory pathway pseudopilin PulG